MCPLCGSKGYAGFLSFECSKEGCSNYKSGPDSEGRIEGGRYKANSYVQFLFRIGAWDIYKAADSRITYLAYYGDYNYVPIQSIPGSKEDLTKVLKQVLDLYPNHFPPIG